MHVWVCKISELWDGRTPGTHHYLLAASVQKDFGVYIAQCSLVPTTGQDPRFAGTLGLPKPLLPWLLDPVASDGKTPFDFPRLQPCTEIVVWAG